MGGETISQGGAEFAVHVSIKGELCLETKGKVQICINGHILHRHQKKEPQVNTWTLFFRLKICFFDQV